MAELQLHHNYGPLAAETKLAQFRESPSVHSAAIPVSISQLQQPEQDVASIILNTTQTKDEELQQIFTDNVAAKLWRVAQRDLKNNVIFPYNSNFADSKNLRKI